MKKISRKELAILPVTVYNGAIAITLTLERGLFPMKKLVAVLLVLVLSLGAVSAFAATGLGSVTSITGKDATADNAGSAQVNTTMCAVTIGEDGKIEAIKFDVAQNTSKFDAAGKYEAPADTTFPTKVEKKEAYGMKGVSGIGKEVYEQMAALEEYCIGKTVEEVLATEVLAEETDGYHTGSPAKDDLKATVTITITDFLAALEKAAANAQ